MLLSDNWVYAYSSFCGASAYFGVLFGWGGVISYDLKKNGALVKILSEFKDSTLISLYFK